MCLTSYLNSYSTKSVSTVGKICKVRLVARCQLVQGSSTVKFPLHNQFSLAMKIKTDCLKHSFEIYHVVFVNLSRIIRKKSQFKTFPVQKSNQNHHWDRRSTISFLIVSQMGTGMYSINQFSFFFPLKVTGTTEMKIISE